MPKIVVQVMPKEELLDPAGKAVQRSLASGGRDHFTSVRIGKRFEIETDREITAALMDEVAQLADDLLSNGVIEDVISIEVAEEEPEAAEEDFVPTGASSDHQAELNEQAN